MSALRAGRIGASIALGAALVFGAPARAQGPAASNGPNAPGGIDLDFAALAKSTPGSWADYTMSIPGRQESPRIRYVLVEKTASKLSLEVDSPTPKGELDVRLDFGAAGPDAWKLASGKMLIGEQALDLPAQQIASATPVKKDAPPGELVGNEDVKTAAGTFTCRHYKKNLKGANIELWMSDKAQPTGLVKSMIGPITLTLVATGKGASGRVK
jgi:hypothetical protein